MSPPARHIELPDMRLVSAQAPTDHRSDTDRRIVTAGPRDMRSHQSWPALLILFCLLSFSPAMLRAQTEPESPKTQEPLRNGFQLSFYTGVALNNFTGGYYTDCPRGNCLVDFYLEDNSWSYPFGASMNIPVFSDAALYLRAGWNSTKTTISSGRVDSLYTQQAVGEILDELTLYYTLFQVDVLVRLIGKQDGERIFLGPSFGFPVYNRAYVSETELSTGRQFLIQDTDVEGAKKMRTSLILGVEYAFVPVRNLYIIPSFQIDYSAQKISDAQPIRPLFYKFLISVSYQLF